MPRSRRSLARVAAKFSENLLDATNGFSIYITKEQTSGIPEDVLQAAREAAQKDGKDGEIHAPHAVLPAGDAVRRRTLLREKMYYASSTRARIRQPAVGQRAAHRENGAAAPRARAAPRLPRFCRGVARAENGQVFEPGACLPRRPRAPRAAVRGAGCPRAKNLRPR